MNSAKSISDMSESNIIGRLPQKHILQQAMDCEESELIAVYENSNSLEVLDIKADFLFG
jgi:hypothetical protein